jgi:glucose/arabinose dehydrogenase
MRKLWPVLLLSLLACTSPAQEPHLTQLKLPAGFHIALFARVPNARMMAFSPGGVLLVSDTQGGRVVALPDANHKGQADRVVTLLSGLNRPHGLGFYQGKLYVAENDKVNAYDWNEQQLKATNPRLNTSLSSDGEHVTRSLQFANGKLYVSVGSSCNVCVEKDPERAAVLEMNPDGSGKHVFASGLRNAVGLTYSRKTGTVWVTENGRDMLGENLPFDEINNLGKSGGNFGWPYCYGDRVPDPKFHDPARCTNTVPAAVDLQAHSAPLGLDFDYGNMFPQQYAGGLFVAFHGSWNRTVPTGYKVVFIRMNAQGLPEGSAQDFITGFMPPADKPDSEWGRPVGILFGPDGAMYVTDDLAGAVYRITYGK